MPADRLVVETDCPFLPPQGHRGKRNEPAYLALTAARVAELRGEPLDEPRARAMTRQRAPPVRSGLRRVAWRDARLLSCARGSAAALTRWGNRRSAGRSRRRPRWTRSARRAHAARALAPARGAEQRGARGGAAALAASARRAVRAPSLRDLRGRRRELRAWTSARGDRIARADRPSRRGARQPRRQRQRRRRSAILLTLLERWTAREPARVRVRLLFPACEELGYLGARVWVREHGVGGIAGVLSLELPRRRRQPRRVGRGGRHAVPARRARRVRGARAATPTRAITSSAASRSSAATTARSRPPACRPTA